MLVSVGGLGITALAQSAVVVVSGSTALLSDTVHNLADALTAVPLALAFVVGRRKPTARYTYGYGRAEDLASVVIVLSIAVSAAVAAYLSLRRFFQPADVDHLGGVIFAGILGLAGNELVARYRIRAGSRLGSAALVAEGFHARTDALSSLMVVVGAAGVGAGWRYADPLAGLVITGLILLVLGRAGHDLLHRLMDAVDPRLVGQAGQLLGQVPGIESVGRVRLRWVGHELHADVEIVVDPRHRMDEVQAVVDRARAALVGEVPRLMSATITPVCAQTVFPIAESGDRVDAA